MIVRAENPQDIPQIRALVTAAFKGAPHSDGSEGAIVDGLRREGALAVSLVAESEGEIVGHVAISAVTIDGQSVDWYGLGPVAVRPDHQRQGVGSKLIEAGISQIRALGAAGCVVLGDASYYCRFGFRVDAALRFPGGAARVFPATGFRPRREARRRRLSSGLLWTIIPIALRH